MYIQRRHWLEYDPVALAVLVIGIGIIDARIDHLTPYPGEGHLRARKEPPRPKGSWPRAALPLSTPKTRQSLAQFAPNRCRDQPRKCPVMQSHGITLAFHRKMADSSREFVGPDVIAAVSLESYPRFIKGGFQDYEALWIKRSIADSKHVPSPQLRLLGNNVFEAPPESSRIFGISHCFARSADLTLGQQAAAESHRSL